MSASFFTEQELCTTSAFKASTFKDLLRLNARTFKDQIRFEGLSRALETGKKSRSFQVQ